VARHAGKRDHRAVRAAASPPATPAGNRPGPGSAATSPHQGQGGKARASPHPGQLQMRSDVTVVADAGMLSEANRNAVEAAGLSFILGAKIAQVPYVIDEWHRQHPGEQVPDGHVFTQPWPAGTTDARRDQVIYYQFRADRAGGHCAASTNRSPKPRKRSPARRR
jgi:hypothetical protein